MPRKDPSRSDLNTYRVYLVNKEVVTVHTPDKLIAETGKPDKGGYHPVFTIDDEVMLNLNEVTHIVNVTPAKEINDEH